MANNPCSNVQSEFGVGCYRSGDIFFLYCTPYSNQLLNERCNGNVSPDSGNSECHRRCEREAERCHRRCDREQVSPESGCNRPPCCRCNCRNNTRNTASVGGDFGNCYY